MRAAHASCAARSVCIQVPCVCRDAGRVGWFCFSCGILGTVVLWKVSLECAPLRSRSTITVSLFPISRSGVRRGAHSRVRRGAHSRVRTPAKFIYINQMVIFVLSYDLKDGKKSPVRARLRAGGERPLGSWRPPAYGRAGEFLAAYRWRGHRGPASGSRGVGGEVAPLLKSRRCSIF